MIFSKQILFTAFLLYAIDIAAQEKTGIEASVDKKKILIGEPFVLRVRAQFPQDIPGRFILMDSIEHFEFVEEPLVDSAGANGSGSYTGIYKLTSFDSGHWVIPSFQLSKQVKTDTIGIDVVFSEFNPEQEYHDIKDIIEVKPEKEIMVVVCSRRRFTAGFTSLLFIEEEKTSPGYTTNGSSKPL
jgi:hypothetical protein